MKSKLRDVNSCNRPARPPATNGAARPNWIAPKPSAGQTQTADPGDDDEPDGSKIVTGRPRRSGHLLPPLARGADSTLVY
jgi:hypothetical protein